MSRQIAPPLNPLTRVARALPERSGSLLALGARIAGSAFAIAVAAQQSYDRTRALAVVLAAVALLSCVPVPGWLRDRLPWLGAGVLFFGGALLAHLDAGKALLLCGALAAAAVAVDEQQHRRPTTVSAFFTGLGVVVLAVTAIVLGIGS